jgi:hypothetical protein
MIAISNGEQPSESESEQRVSIVFTTKEPFCTKCFFQYPQKSVSSRDVSFICLKATVARHRFRPRNAESCLQHVGLTLMEILPTMSCELDLGADNTKSSRLRALSGSMHAGVGVLEPKGTCDSSGHYLRESPNSCETPQSYVCNRVSLVKIWHPRWTAGDGSQSSSPPQQSDGNELLA